MIYQRVGLGKLAELFPRQSRDAWEHTVVGIFQGQQGKRAYLLRGIAKLVGTGDEHLV